MKKIQKIVVGVLIIALIVGGVALFADYNKRKAVGNDSDNVTNNSEETSNIDVKETRTKIEELPQDYSFIQAIKDGCVYSSNGTKVYNKDELDSFLENVNNNIPDSIRCISYTVEGDMLITDVSFGENDSFTTCCDWTRDEYSGEEDRTYLYGEFTKLNTDEMDDNVEIYLTNQTQGKLEKVYICGYSKDAQVVNNYEFNYLLDVENPQDGLIKKITSNEKLSEIYDYDIYYYGFDSLKIQIGNEKMDLEQALVEGKVTMEQIIEQAERDRKAGIIGSDMYKEGGTMIYFYGTYTIIKKHTVDGNRDVYIGMPEMRLNTIKYETTN